MEPHLLVLIVSSFLPSEFMPRSHLISISIAVSFHPKLRSVSTLLSAFTNDSVTLSVGLLNQGTSEESGLCGVGQEAF